jgi:hypothetical protein
MMKKLPQHLEDILLDYLDGNLTSARREEFEQLLKANSDLQVRLEELRMADQVLRHLSVEQPSKNFTSLVMSRLDQYPARTGFSNEIQNGILLLTGIIIVMAIAVTLVYSGVFNENTTFDPNRVTWIHRYIKQTLPSISIDGKLIVNVIILMNMALAFIVLDRTILRPIFRQRMGEAAS